MECTHKTGSEDRISAVLAASGLRPTRQRRDLCHLIYGNGDRHFTAEELYSEARQAGVDVSLATVYNTLKKLANAEAIREIHLATNGVCYDTRTDDHPHFYWEDTGHLEDAPVDSVRFSALPGAPEGAEIRKVDVILRVARTEA